MKNFWEDLKLILPYLPGFILALWMLITLLASNPT
jgi:hypothetical protein